MEWPYYRRVLLCIFYLQVSWQAKISLTSTQVDDVVLADQLVKTAGSVMCPAQQSLCTFDVSLKEDEVCVIYLISGLRSFRNVLEFFFFNISNEY